MSTKHSFGAHNNHQGAGYIHRRGIQELFEAIMTGLIFHKPDDHFAYIRECLDKAQSNPGRLRWDYFVASSTPTSTTSNNHNHTKGVILSKPTVVKSRAKPLPPVRRSNPITKANPTATRPKAVKAPPLPPIDQTKKMYNPPIVLILSASSSTRLCSKLIERYNEVAYLSINDTANIDDDVSIDLKGHEHRYDDIHHAVEIHRSNSNGFIVAGHIDEVNFCDKWLENLGRIDLVVILSRDGPLTLNRQIDCIHIDLNRDFDIMLADVIHVLDEIFPNHILTSEHVEVRAGATNHFSLPVIFCIDTQKLLTKENNINENNINGSDNKLAQHPSIDNEFDATDEKNEVETNNSFINTLCARLAEQFSLKHISVGNSHNILLDFNQLQAAIVESMSSCTGYIIEHFPTSFNDLQKFQDEIGTGSALIYIGEHQTEEKNGEIKMIIEKFKQENKAIYIDCRMEVDEIYEDLKKDILQRI